jgi:hypothetical protein
MSLVLVSLACLTWTAAQDPAPKSRPTKAVESVFGLEIPLPEGWTRNDEPEGGVTLVPPRLKEAPLEPPQYILLLLPPQPLRGTLWETQRSIFDELQKQLLKETVPPKHEPSVPGPFIRTSTAGKDKTNWTQTLRLNGVLTEAGYVSLVMYGSENSRTIGTILNGVVVKNPPKAAAKPRIVEAWRRLAQQAVTEFHNGAALLTAVPYDRLWLRSDGVADFTPLYPEGHAASPLPPKIDAKMLQGFYGAWTAVGDRDVHVSRAADKPAQVYRRENGKLLLGNQVWEPMASVDGLKLDGKWNLPGASRPRRIEFTAAGRFKDDGLLEDVGHVPVYAWAGGHVVRLPKPPARGEGRYEIRDFTLLLTYDDGAAWSADFSIEGNDPKDLSKLLLRAGTLHRER